MCSQFVQTLSFHSSPLTWYYLRPPCLDDILCYCVPLFVVLLHLLCNLCFNRFRRWLIVVCCITTDQIQDGWLPVNYDMSYLAWRRGRLARIDQRVVQFVDDCLKCDCSLWMAGGRGRWSVGQMTALWGWPVMDDDSDDDGREEVGRRQYYGGMSGGDLWSEVLWTHMVWVVDGNMVERVFCEMTRELSYIFFPRRICTGFYVRSIWTIIY